MSLRSLSATCTFALRFPNGELAFDPTDWRHTTTDLSLAHLWLWPIDESAEQRAAHVQEAQKRMHYPLGVLAVVRAR